MGSEERFVAAESNQALPPQAETAEKRKPGIPRLIILICIVMLGFAGFYVVSRRLQPGSPVAPAAALPSDADLQDGNAESGMSLFAKQACSACHVVEKGQSATVGPNLSNIGNRAATRQRNRTAAQYLWESMMTPNAFVAPGFGRGLMPQDFRQKLSSQDVKDLIAYLLTLKSGQD
jgi:mono/diheme cytochrome c family protein